MMDCYLSWSNQKEKKLYVFWIFICRTSQKITSSFLSSNCANGITKGTNSFYYIHPPMIVGQAYRHMLQKGKTLAYSAGRLDKEQIRYSLNVFRRKGISKIIIQIVCIL